MRASSGEPIAVALIALLLVLVISSRHQGRQLLAQNVATSAEPASELVPIGAHCKAVRQVDDTWEPIEAYLAYRTPDKFTRSLRPTCVERLAS